MAFFLFLRKILESDKLEGADFKYSNNFFLILAQKYPNKAFLVPNVGIFFLHKILQLSKFKGVDLKYDNSFFKIIAQKYPNKAFLVPN